MQTKIEFSIFLLPPYDEGVVYLPVKDRDKIVAQDIFYDEVWLGSRGSVKQANKAVRMYILAPEWYLKQYIIHREPLSAT